MTITTKTVTVCTCDLCKKTVVRKSEIHSVRIPVKFLTEQTEGRSVEPYIVLENLDLCFKCLEKATTLSAIGAQGYNTYKFEQ